MSRVFRRKLSKAEFRAAVVCAVLFAAVASVLFMCGNFHVRRWNPFEKIALENILTAKTDAAGNTYIIDSGMSRITKMNADGSAEYEITGGSVDTIFYNARDVAAEDEKSLFVHDVAWDSSGMSVASERVLEFDKNSGSLSRELYRVDRDGSNSDRRLSALIELSSLKFADGRLWFARKGKGDFALYSLVPGEEPRVEYVAPYEDALLTLGDFTVDVAGKRVFFVDKAGVVRVLVFADNEVRNEVKNEVKNEIKNEVSYEGKSEIKVVFKPISGASVREFSLPYRLSFGGGGLYFSDIGKRAVMRLEDANKAKTVFGGWEGASVPPLYLSLYHSLHHSAYFGDERLTLAGANSVIRITSGGEEIFRVSSLPAGRRIVLLRLCFWVSALFLLSSSLLAAAVVFRFVNSGQMNGKEGLSFAVIVVMALTFVAITPTILDGVKNIAKEEIMKRLSYIMEMSSKTLDAEALAGIGTPQDYNGPAYRKFKRSLDNLVNRGNEWDRQIYCDVFKFKEGIQYSVCFLDETIGAFFNPRSLEDSGARTIAENGRWIKDMGYHDVSGNYMFLSGPIRDAGGGVVGGIEVGVDLRSLEHYIFTLSRKIMVHILFILALMLFFISEIFECVPFTFSFTKTFSEDDGEIPPQYFRPITFVVFLTFNLSIAFLPNYALKMDSSFMGFSPAISAVLPVIASDAMMTVAPLILPFLIARLGRRLSFAVSFILCAAGYAVCAVTATLVPLVAGMGVLGLGAGILFTLLQTYIASRSDADERALDFSFFTSSSFSGMNCGVMIGGIVATYFGQRAVFYLGSFLWLLVMAVFLILAGIKRMKTMKKKKAEETVKTEKKSEMETGARTGPESVPASLTFPRGIMAYLFLAFFPFTLYSGFVHYLVPVFGSRAGFSDTEISLVFMFFGMGITLLGSKIVALTRGETVKVSFFLWLALILELSGILCFASFQSVAAMLAAVFILGGAYGVGNVYFPLYLTEMPEAKTLWEGGSMALFNFTEGMGFIVGPMVFNVIFYSGSSLWYYLLAALMFLSSLLYHAVRRDVAEVRQ